jgi:hypothetical protein
LVDFPVRPNLNTIQKQESARRTLRWRSQNIAFTVKSLPEHTSEKPCP